MLIEIDTRYGVNSNVAKLVIYPWNRSISLTARKPVR